MFIDKKIFEGFVEHSIVQFHNVPDMLAADLKDNSIVLTLGYYAEGDMGGTFYLIKDFNPGQCALDYFLTMDNNAQIAIPIIVTPYVTPEMFGAKGGTEDDADALQLALDFGYKEEKTVLLIKDYSTSQTLTIYGGADNTQPGTTVQGINKGYAKITALAAMTDLISIDSEANDCANVFLSHIQIDCGSLADNGVTFQKSTANCEFFDLKINNALQTGVTNKNNLYLSAFKKVRVDNTPEGFKFVAGINTSLNMMDCYVQNATNAYQIQAIYSVYNNCCADSITGTVFNFTHFTGSAISCGSEASGAEKMFAGGLGTNVSVINAMTFSLTRADAVHIDCGPGSSWRFIGGRISHSETNVTAPGKLYQLALSASLDFDNVTLGKAAVSNDYSNITARVNFKGPYGDVLTRYAANVAFIGMDGHETGGNIEPADVSNTTKANALYMGLDDRQHKADGTDLQWNTYTMKGDILLTQDPVKYACAGWIQADDVSGISGARWITGTYKKIPIVMSGPTADRPTLYSQDAGVMYLDTTIIKPVWWTGSRWIDATGTTA